MMKLTKREKMMLQLLCGLVILYGYFYLLVGPQLEKLRDLKVEKASSHGVIQEVETSLSSKELLEKEIKKIQQNIEKQNKNYFTTLQQGTILLLLEQWFNAVEIHVPAITFSEYSFETVADVELKGITVTVPFEGQYEALMELLKLIREHEKRIIISQLNINNNLNEIITGSMLLEFYSVRDGVLTEGDNLLIESTPKKVNPFNPFVGYIHEFFNLIEQEKDYSPEYNNNNIFDNSFNNSPVIKDNSNGEVNISKNTKKTVLLNDFETLNTFFVGEPRDIVGTLSLDKQASNGQHSLKLEYDFIRPRQKTSINVVFEGDKIVLDQQPEDLLISVYGFEESQHRISMVLRDAKGKEHIILISPSINWTGWKKLQFKPPLGVSYPAEIKRIFIETESFDATTRSTLLIDQLEAVYNDEHNDIKKVEDSTDVIKYEVKAGDTLFSISRKFYNDPAMRHLIMENNKISDPNQMKVGQILLIPKIK